MENETPFESNPHARKIRLLRESDRKSSNSDLQSRLKTRKLLGLGGSNGKIYFSKVSQIFGLDGVDDGLVNETTRNSFLMTWLFINSAVHLIHGILSILLPSISMKLELGDNEGSLVSHRLYGVALTGYGIVSIGNLLENRNISWCLASNAIIHALQVLVSWTWASSWSVTSCIVTLRLIAVVINVVGLPIFNHKISHISDRIVQSFNRYTNDYNRVLKND